MRPISPKCSPSYKLRSAFSLLLSEYLFTDTMWFFFTKTSYFPFAIKYMRGSLVTAASSPSASELRLGGTSSGGSSWRSIICSGVDSTICSLTTSLWKAYDSKCFKNFYSPICFLFFGLPPRWDATKLAVSLTSTGFSRERSLKTCS